MTQDDLDALSEDIETLLSPLIPHEVHVVVVLAALPETGNVLLVTGGNQSPSDRLQLLRLAASPLRRVEKGQ